MGGWRKRWEESVIHVTVTKPEPGAVLAAEDTEVNIADKVPALLGLTFW